MLPVTYISKLLESSPELLERVPDSKIYLIDVPKDYRKVENSPMIRINEINDYLIDYADNKARNKSVDIQIDLWCRTIKETESIQKIIDEIMAENDWGQYASALDTDPDINELYRYARRYRGVIPVSKQTN